MSSNKKVVNAMQAGTKEYQKVLNDISKENKCPFCLDQRLAQAKPIKELHRDGSWIIANNNYSYENAEHRYLILGDKHKERLDELTTEDLESAFNLARWAVKKNDIPGAALCIRFGDTKYTGATVCHLHFQLLSPKEKPDGVDSVYFPIG